MNHSVAPVRTYVLVFLALMVLTFTTVAVSRVELGEFNVVVAVTIAVVKATLVALFFMHVKDSSATTKLFIAAGLVWLIILLTFVLSDYLSRGWSPGGRWW